MDLAVLDKRSGAGKAQIMMQGPQIITMRVRVTGLVQGVWYRAWTKQQADRLGFFGWVRNRSDGSVEALMKGSGPAVAQMIELCREGPELARVDDIQTEPVTEETPDRFDNKPTV